MANLSLLEQKVTQMFSIFPLPLYAFHYPNEYLAVADTALFEKNSFILKQFAADNKVLLKIAVGKSTSIYQLSDSYSSARTALKSINDSTEDFVMFDDFMLEIILSGLGEQEKKSSSPRLLQVSQKKNSKLSLLILNRICPCTTPANNYFYIKTLSSTSLITFIRKLG